MFNDIIYLAFHPSVLASLLRRILTHLPRHGIYHVNDEFHEIKIYRGCYPIKFC